MIDEDVVQRIASTLEGNDIFLVTAVYHDALYITVDDTVYRVEVAWVG